MATYTITSEQAATALAVIRKMSSEERYQGACIVVADLVEDYRDYKEILKMADSLYPTVLNDILKPRKRKKAK